MACQNPVCRECGSSKGLSHDRPSLRAAHAPSNAVTPNQVRVMTELAPGCPVRTFLYCACARVRERHARPCQVQHSRGQKKRPCQSVRANRRHGIPPALPPQPSPALRCCFLSPSAKRSTTILRRISHVHITSIASRGGWFDQEREASQGHRTARANLAFLPGLLWSIHLTTTGGFCAHSQVHVNRHLITYSIPDPSTRPAQSAHHRALGPK